MKVSVLALCNEKRFVLVDGLRGVRNFLWVGVFHDHILSELRLDVNYRKDLICTPVEQCSRTIRKCWLHFQNSEFREDLGPLRDRDLIRQAIYDDGISWPQIFCSEFVGFDHVSMISEPYRSVKSYSSDSCL